jgi:hypothetical protein
MRINKNFDDGVAWCDRQIQMLTQQRQSIDRMIAKYENKKNLLIQKQQQNDQKL